MNLFTYIIWNASPNVIPALELPRWYGVLFALGFVFSSMIITWMFKQEKIDLKHIERLTTYLVVATIIGARLGHCLFYDPQYYLTHPLEILKVWEGGLASHGGAIAILIALYLYIRKYKDFSYLWILDRIVIVVCLTGAMIRTGNFMNSEMIGKPTDLPIGVFYARPVHDAIKAMDQKISDVSFKKGGNKSASTAFEEPTKITVTFSKVLSDQEIKRFFDQRLKSIFLGFESVSMHIKETGDEPLQYEVFKSKGETAVVIHTLVIKRHAAQLYEAFYCLLLMGILFLIWKFKRSTYPEGVMFSIFMIVLWTMRFFDEFLKENQVEFEENLTYNMGQLLSIPMVLAGIILLVVVFVNQRQKQNTIS